MKMINKTQIQQMIDKKDDFLLVNVLPKKDFDAKHIPNSINVPFEDSEKFVEELKKQSKTTDKKVVVYCSGADCNMSEKAAKKLETAKFTNVLRYTEGTEGWFEGKNKAAA